MSMEKQEQGGPKNDDRGLGGYMSRRDHQGMQSGEGGVNQEKVRDS